MISLEIQRSDVRKVVDTILLGADPKSCVPDTWKLEANREALDEVYQDVCMSLWFEMGDTALNRSGYTNALTEFWNEVIGKKLNKNKTNEVEHWDESWYF